jgi:anti-anti-sigma factor
MTGEPCPPLGARGRGERAPAQPLLEVLRERGLCVVRAAGEHDLGTAEALRRAIADCLAHEGRVVVDLRGATFVDFRIIGVLALCHRQAATRPGHAFALVADEASLVGRVLRLTGLETVVPVYPGLAQAAEAMA